MFRGWHLREDEVKRSEVYPPPPHKVHIIMVKCVHQLMIINIFLSTSECLAKNGWNKLKKKPGKMYLYFYSNDNFLKRKKNNCVNCDPTVILKGCFGERGDPHVSCFKSSQLFIFIIIFFWWIWAVLNLPLDNECKGVKIIYNIVGYTVTLWWFPPENLKE